MGAPLEMPHTILEEFTETKEVKAYQNLIMPINISLLRMGHFSEAFRIRYNKEHYGTTYEVMDGQSQTVWASGTGKVLKKGWDTNFWNVVIIRYDICNLHNDYAGVKPAQVVICYFNLGSISVSENQSVTNDTKIGTAGPTGPESNLRITGIHIEIDKDLQYPEYSPSLLKGQASRGIIKSGIDDTMVRAEYALVCKTTAPDYQKVNAGPKIDSYTGSFWYGTSEFNLIKYF